MWMYSKNLKNGKKEKVKMKAGTDTLSAGSSECDYKTEIEHTSGYKVGTKNIPALFWNPMLSTNGKKATKARAGND